MDTIETIETTLNKRVLGLSIGLIVLIIAMALLYLRYKA